MNSRDARKLPPEALEDLRRRVVAAVESGVPQVDVARLFGVSRQTVSSWMNAYRTLGDDSFRPRRRGRRPGEQLALSVAKQTWVIRMLTSRFPDQLGTGSWLWTRQVIAELIHREFGLLLGVTTIGNYLVRWGFPGEQNMLRTLRGNNAVVVVGSRGGPDEQADDWIEGGEVLWAGCVRPRWSVAAHPADPWQPSAAGQELPEARFLVAVSNRGAMYFLPCPDPEDARQVSEFLSRVSRQLGRKVNVIAGWRPQRNVDTLRSWRRDNGDQAAVRFVTR
jgi:transposase